MHIDDANAGYLGSESHRRGRGSPAGERVAPSKEVSAGFFSLEV